MMTSVPPQAASDLTPEIGASARRTFLKMAAAAGLAAAGSSFLTRPVRAAGTSPAAESTIQQIFSVARTAEQLSVTFYRNGIDNAAALGIHGDALDIIKSAAIHEQLHQLFFTANGGESLADNFSFPNGPATFTDQQLFFETQQILEGMADTALLAAVREFADLGQSSLAQIAAQTACVEQEHRALGRQIGGLGLADNRAYTPVLVAYVADAPGVLKDLGFLSPTRDAQYRYIPLDFHAEIFQTVEHEIEYKAPYAVRPYSLPS